MRPPTEDDIRDLGEQLHLDLTHTEIEDFRELVDGSLNIYETVREVGHPPNPYAPERPHDSGYRVREDDPYNAWITKCDIELSTTGPLTGWDVGLKDNIAVAGVEMTCGSTVMEGYTPNVDAAIVGRLLNAGGRVIGKTNMDDMALAANGSSSAFGSMLNPVDDDYLAGGSSGGSAIAVATGDADLTVGGDQGGSVRVPAAWSGVVGFKPSYGLVPYVGITGLENSIDHIGTFTSDVPKAARALSVLAGEDPRDPRQPAAVPTEDYQSSLDGDVSDLSIAVIEEGFTRAESEPEVNESVRAALDGLADHGATVKEVSLPIHDVAHEVYTVALMEGLLATVDGEGLGHNWKGWYDVSWVEAFGKYRRSQGGDFPPTVKLALLTGAYMREQYHSKYYAEAMNLRAEITRRHEELLESYDLVAMPTTPQTAQRHEPGLDRIEFIARAWTSLPNVSTFNVTGQPAVSVPVERVNGLPVGLQLAGRRFDDATVLNGAHAVEEMFSANA